jgi:hypothetical protein
MYPRESRRDRKLGSDETDAPKAIDSEEPEDAEDSGEETHNPPAQGAPRPFGRRAGNRPRFDRDR